MKFVTIVRSLTLSAPKNDAGTTLSSRIFLLRRKRSKAKINILSIVSAGAVSDGVVGRVKRYALVGSHTARRSFATNLYLSGISAGRIMLLTGHKTEEAFFRYIRINKEENAKILSEHAFFK